MTSAILIKERPDAREEEAGANPWFIVHRFKVRAYTTPISTATEPPMTTRHAPAAHRPSPRQFYPDYSHSYARI
jgi:hypothetical protein